MKVIRDLRKITEGMQSGDDSPLKNVWDEICVQMQTEESVMWEVYLDVISSLIKSELKPLSREILQSIWLQTNEGGDWESEIADQISEGELKEYDVTVACNEDDIAEYILHEYILHAASDFTNKRIEKFIDEGYDVS